MRKELARLSLSCDLVLDSSMTLAWLFEDEGTAYTKSIRRSLDSGTALVPSLWMFEVANTLLVGLMRNRCTLKEIHQWLRLLEQLPMEVAPVTTHRSMSDWIDFARKHGLTVYDASYLVLAWDTGLPTASLDAKVISIASKIGIECYDPDSLL
jgi:predicted nucleic acid-binding protein